MGCGDLDALCKGLQRSVARIKREHTEWTSTRRIEPSCSSSLIVLPSENSRGRRSPRFAREMVRGAVAACATVASIADPPGRRRPPPRVSRGSAPAAALAWGSLMIVCLEQKNRSPTGAASGHAATRNVLVERDHRSDIGGENELIMLRGHTWQEMRMMANVVIASKSVIRRVVS